MFVTALIAVVTADVPYAKINKNGCSPLTAVVSVHDKHQTFEECAKAVAATGNALFTLNAAGDCTTFAPPPNCDTPLYITTELITENDVEGAIVTDLKIVAGVLGTLLALSHLWIAHFHYHIFDKKS
jgi:hypothetical protein